MKRLSMLFIISIVAIISGCTSDKSKPAEHSPELTQLVASEKTLPINFEKYSEQSEPRGIFAELVNTQHVFENSWKEFELEGTMPKVDFNTNDVLFIGMMESSSCPYIIDSLKGNLAENQLTISFVSLNDVCTADLSPRNFVIAIDKKLSSELSSFKIVTDQENTEVPISVKSVEEDRTRSK